MSNFNPYVDGDDGDAEREDRAFEWADRKSLIEQRHALANRATVARLTADMLYLELAKLDEKIKESL